MMRARWTKRTLSLMALVVASWCAAPGRSDEPTYFRGDQGRTSNDAQALPVQFDDAQQLLWRQSVAPGHSTPCVTKDSIYLTTYADDQLHTVALDRRTGRVKWSQRAPAEKIETFHPTGSPAASTPACDGERVYVVFGSYGILCYDLKGAQVWSKPLGPFQDEFGSASSPVLVDGRLLVNEDHDVNSFLLCVDAKSGRTLWKTSRDGFTRSYSTPVLVRREGRTQVIVAGALQLVSYDLETGKQLWSLDGLARIVNTTPASDGKSLFVATWSPGGDTDARVAMEPWDVAIKAWDKNKDGKLRRDEVDNKEVLDRFYRIDLNQDEGLDQAEWQKYARVFELARNSLMALKLSDSPQSAPEITWQYDKGLPYVASPLLYRGVLYMVKDGGIVTSLDPTTGKVLKQGRGRSPSSYYASPVAGDGKVYLLGERGVLTVLRASGDWEILSSHDFQERAVATPVIDDGQVLIRTEKSLYLFGKKS